MTFQTLTEINLERAMLLGWVTNNYWETNFPGAQPGTVTARYTILPYEGEVDESRAHQFAAEAEHSRPLVQHLGEPAATQLLPESGTLFHLPEPPILVLNLRTESDFTLLTLYNASDVPRTTTIQSGLLPIIHAALCGLFGEVQKSLPMQNDSVQIEIARRMICTLRIHYT